MWAVLALTSALFAASNSIFQKESLRKLHAVQLATVSGAIAILFSVFLLPFASLSLPLNKIALIIVYSVVQAVAMIFTIRAMRHLDVSIVAPFFNIGTAITALLAVFIFGEVVTGFGVIGILFLVLGGYLLELKHRNLLQPFRELFKSSSMHYLLGGVFLYSVGYILAKFGLETINPVTFLIYQQIFAFVTYAAVTFFVYKGWQDVTEGFRKGRYLIYVVALFTLLENILLFAALRRGEASLVIPLYRTWTLWAVIFGCRFLNEKHIAKKVFASLLMILGATLILI